MQTPKLPPSSTATALCHAQVELTGEFTAAYADAPMQPPSGGDFYNAFPVQDGDVAVVLGDVAGHGPEQTEQAEHMRELLSDCLAAGLDPAEALTAVNALIEPDPNFDGFGTVFVGRLEAETGKMTYASGGQEPGLIATPVSDGSGSNGSGASEAVCVEQLEGTGSLVGAFPPEMTQFEQHDTVVPAGGTLLLYTDGVSEARPPQEHKNWLGIERLKAILACVALLPPRRLVPALMKRVSEFCRGRFADDVAVLAIRRRDPRKVKVPPI